MRFIAAALLLCATASAQITVDEKATRARLINNSTSVLLAILNQFAKPVDTRVELAWLDPQNVRHGHTQFNFTAQPGASFATAALPLTPKGDPLFFRLSYSIFPDTRNLTAFSPVRGVVSFPLIAEHAFRLTATGIGVARLDKPYELRVFASHPITSEPVRGVQISHEGKPVVTTDSYGAAVVRLMPDREEWEFSNNVTLRGLLGDLEQTTDAGRPGVTPNDVRIYTDKPLYQPGQTVHLRILALGSDRKVRSGAEYSVEISDERSTTMYSADLKTSPYGIAHTDWEIPSNAPNGNYEIEVEDTDAGTTYQHHVEIRRYELPSFRVTVRPDRTYYLPGQKAVVEVRADYLFGKPVGSGKVRVSEADEEDPLQEGVLDTRGTFKATLDLAAAAEGLNDDRFADLHYVAYVTDAGTNRTEKRQFDLRLSREPLHVYVLDHGRAASWRSIYVTTYTPDGKPAVSDVEVLLGTRVLGTGKTNRLGVAKIVIPPDTSGELTVRARAPEGQAVQSQLALPGGLDIRLETDRVLYTPGQPIRCRITSMRPDLHATLLAWNQRGDTLISKSLLVVNGSAEAVIPFDPRFGNEVTLEVLSPSGSNYQTWRSVLYPGAEDLRTVAAPGAPSYRPGEEASLTVRTTSSSGAPVQTALGVAVVDESVLERAASDATNRRRSYHSYASQDWKISGFGVSDLLSLDPARIDADLQLVAEALLPSYPVNLPATTFLDEQRSEYTDTAAKALAPYLAELDRIYRQNLEYPRTEEALKRMFPIVRPEDPWMQPYRVEFVTEGTNDVLRFVSSGPDKTFGTEDDFVAHKVEREWFALEAALIRKALERLTDYPATVAEFEGLLAEDGIQLARRKDPWGRPLRAVISHRRENRILTILSSGPDREYGTADDFPAATFTGSYFHAAATRINAALGPAAEFSADESQLRSRLASSGFDLSTERDPWGKPYYLSFRTDSQFSQRYRHYTYSDYAGVPEDRAQVIPTKTQWAIARIHSSGEDGIPGTYDDFVVVQFRRLVAENQESARSVATAAAPSITLGGRGSITGVIVDVTGAVIPRAEVTLNDIYRTETDSEGRYYFRGLPEGKYTVEMWSPGFQATVIGNVPVTPGRVTLLDGRLNVGTVAESVTVEAAPALLQTQNAMMVSQGVAAADTPTSTPRVREYFPETLYWAPEIVTDSSGRASLKFKLADSITTWHVAMIGSTVDGRIAEATAAIKAFQPFFVDLDPPQVLTVGDEISLPVPIRNYLDSAQNVAVDVTAAAALQIAASPKRQENISANSAANHSIALRASAADNRARLRVTARGQGGADAIEKPIAIHPDGEPVSRAVSELVSDGRVLRIDIPGNAIPGSMHAEVKVYPNLLAHVIESMESLLRMPYGCAEQTISSTYPNLLFLRALKVSGLREPRLEERARKYLEAGYRRLLGYRKPEGGFGYWGNSPIDIAVTAYAITFLEDASRIISVDGPVIEGARSYLAEHATDDVAVQSVALRALAKAGAEHEAAVVKRLGELARSAVEFDDPYALATFALAALDAGRPELASPVVERLRGMVHDEQGAAWWSLRRNTPYYGWGRAGVIESTALVVTALSEWQSRKGSDPQLAGLVDRGVAFLLRSKDGRGAWLTGQATVRVFEALIRALAAPENKRSPAIEIRVNGMPAGRIAMPEGQRVTGPTIVDVSRFLKPGIANEVALATPAGRLAAQVQFAADWYQPWDQPRTSPDFHLSVKYGASEAAVNDSVRCDVTVSRPTFRGYGMMIAEVGLPPGAEVDRASLAELLERNNGVDSFEVAPDRVVFYIWPRAADSSFTFHFRPRYPMQARTAPSALYDYYNPEARVVVAPAMFRVR